MFSVVLLDLDDFKRVNDGFGHDAGDRALRVFADVLRRAMRETDVAARIGGEEFAMPPALDRRGGGRTSCSPSGSGPISRIERSCFRTAAAVSITASLGIAVYPEAKTAEALLRVADRALYRAKAEGKNRVVASGGAR